MFLSSLMKPDRFKGDPVGWAANQCAHTLLGILAAFFTSLLWFWFYGEMPEKRMILLFWSAFYLGVIELLIQGWNGWDTVEDTIFFSLFGVGSAVALFTEVSPGQPELRLDVVNGWPFFIGFLCALIAGIVRRIRHE